MGSQQFCLKWNNHQMNLLAVFDQLLQNEAFVDVTLACEGVSLKAHKMVLSACSPYFQTLFLDNPCKHPIVILNSMRYIDLKAIIDFMYKGEVNVSQDQLSALLKTAEMLKVKGLAEVTNQTKQNIVAGGAMPPLSASPPLPHVGQRSPPHIRTSLSPPPKRKKLRTSAMSSAASSPQTPTMSSSIPASSVTDSSQPVLDPKIVSQTSLADLSQDGHSDPDGLSRHSSAEQNNDSVPDLRLEPTLEIKEDHSPSTSNMASDMSYDALPPDLSNTDHPGMDTSSLSAGPSTSGIQSQSSETGQVVIPVKCEAAPNTTLLTKEEIERLRNQCIHVKQFATGLAKLLFTREERRNSNTYAVGRFKGLDRSRVDYLRRVALSVWGIPPEHAEDVWNQCVTAINAHCRYLRWKVRMEEGLALRDPDDLFWLGATSPKLG